MGGLNLRMSASSGSSVSVEVAAQAEILALVAEVVGRSRGLVFLQMPCPLH